MNGWSYIQVILPLKLEWEPWYSTTESLAVGSRVAVRFSGREYVAVVSSVCDVPGIDPAKVQPVLGVPDRLESILPSELEFWRFIASYYMCTVGEVYKFAYPAARTAVEGKRANVTRIDDTEAGPRRLTEDGKAAVRSILDAFDERKPVLLTGLKRESVYAELARRTIESGRDALILRSTAPKLSYAVSRERAKAVRSDIPHLLEGGRADLFLPFTKLGLIIVDEEHDASYKHSSGAPRFQTRDAAVALAGLCGANVLLASATPSLESLCNARTGKYSSVSLPCEGGVEAHVIGVADEYGKNGMSGCLSKKLLSRMEAVEGRKLIICPWEPDPFPKLKGTRVIRLRQLGSETLGRYALVALLNAEALLGKDDFRADERAFQLLRRLSLECTGELVIQTRESSHPLFATGGDAFVGLLLGERKEFSFPPYSRMIDIRLKDSNAARLEKMKALLASALGGSLQLFLPKDRNLAASKDAILSRVRAFERERKYFGHIIIDVDP